MTKKETSLSELGIYGLIEHINKKFKLKKETTVRGFNDDSIIVHLPNHQLLSNSMMMEGIHFDLIYTPLQHLGFKMVVNAITDVLAMNALPEQIIVNAGLSTKMTLESTELLVSGMMAACEEYKVDLVAFKPAPSLTGLTLSAAVLGSSPMEELVLRTGAQSTDLLCVTGDLGGALIGLHLLEREKRVLKAVDTVTPEFGDNEYVLRRQLKPEARWDKINQLKENKLKPTSMIAVKEGLAAATLLLCQGSDLGCRVYEDKIPLNQKTLKTAKEIEFNPLIAALNGGEDYELLFTISLDDFQKHEKELSSIATVVGHMTEKEKACRIISLSGDEINLKAQGWGNKEA